MSLTEELDSEIPLELPYVTDSSRNWTGASLLVGLPELLAASSQWLFSWFSELEGTSEVILTPFCRWRAFRWV